MGKGFLTDATATTLKVVSDGYSYGFDIIDTTGDSKTALRYE